MNDANRESSPTGSFRRYSLLLIFTVLGYLFQACVMPYLNIFGVTPNLLYAVIAIVTVAYGKLRAFWVGMIYGLIMEIMLPSITYLNLAIYPITTLFCSFPFADKPLKRLEYDRAMNRETYEMPAWLRTVLCAGMNVFIYEAVNVTYIYLGGSALTAAHIGRAVLDVLLTMCLTLILEFPVRRAILGRKTETPVLKSAPVVFGKR